jgi:hypothetical protein
MKATKRRIKALRALQGHNRKRQAFNLASLYSCGAAGGRVWRFPLRVHIKRRPGSWQRWRAAMGAKIPGERVPGSGLLSYFDCYVLRRIKCFSPIWQYGYIVKYSFALLALCQYADNVACVVF